jgi:2-oxoglutarate dehydrogenase complex dehydrogenase (E1) component-like enzyme
MSDENEDHVTEIKKDTHIQHNDLSMYQLDDTNWIIAHLTTPANYFHILRRQLALPFRKPLIMMSPKSLLRLPECRSSFDEMINGNEKNKVYLLFLYFFLSKEQALNAFIQKKVLHQKSLMKLKKFSFAQEKLIMI